MKIVDCFLFYNELKMLEFRLKELNDIVDYFVVVESTVTFTNKPKLLHYYRNADLFQEYKDKIIHIIVDDSPNIDTPWDIEYYQRQCICRGIEKIQLNDEDVIILTDVDEIPNKNILKNVKDKKIIVDKTYGLAMDIYTYNFYNKSPDRVWSFPKFFNYAIYKFFQETYYTLNHVRCNHDFYTFQNGGWHLTYFGDNEFIKNKITAFSHQEFNKKEYLNDDYINKRIKSNLCLFDDTNYVHIPLEENNFLPENYKMLL